MKKIISLIAILLFFATANAQNVVVTDDNSYTGENSAMLDVKSTTKGFLCPRMTEAEKDIIGSVATGMIIFQIDGESGLYINTGPADSPFWKKMATDRSKIKCEQNEPEKYSQYR